MFWGNVPFSTPRLIVETEILIRFETSLMLKKMSFLIVHNKFEDVSENVEFFKYHYSYNRKRMKGRAVEIETTFAQWVS